MKKLSLIIFRLDFFIFIMYNRIEINQKRNNIKIC